VTRISAAILWLVLGIAVGTGCIPIVVPVVQQDITTGEKLRAIDLELKRATIPNSSGAYTEAKYQTLSADQCKELRRRLIAGPPSMFAYVYADSGTTQENYSGFNPGMYEPEDRERIALKRALDIGVVTQAEFDELTLEAGIQAQRYLVRHGFETAIVALYVRTEYHSRMFVGNDVGDRNRWVAYQWIRTTQSERYGWGGHFGDPNMTSSNPSARNYREWWGGTAFYMEPHAAVPPPAPTSPQ
jgi:hypothetical protein